VAGAAGISSANLAYFTLSAVGVGAFIDASPRLLLVGAAGLGVAPPGYTWLRLRSPCGGLRRRARFEVVASTHEGAAPRKAGGPVRRRRSAATPKLDHSAEVRRLDPCAPETA